MKRLQLVLTFAFVGFCVYGQDVDFKKHYRVSIENKTTPIMVKKKLDNPKIEYKDYERHILPNGKTTIVQKIVKSNFAKNLDTINSKIFTDSKYQLINVAVKHKGSELILYPYSFDEKHKEIRKYLKNHQLVLKIEEGKNISLPFRGWQVGALSVPVKVYLNSRADKLKNNFMFDESINLKISRIWGKEYFYKKKEDKEDKSFQNYFNTSFFIGLSKTEINNKNTTNDIGDESFNVASLNYGFGFGYSVRGIGLSVLLGLDSPLSDEADNWNFKNQLWLGFGFGIDL